MTFYSSKGFQVRRRSTLQASYFKFNKYFIIENYVEHIADPNQGQTMGQRIVRTAQDNLNQGIRMLSSQSMVRPPLIPTTVGEATVSPSEPSEIPDNVTAELEKLEQEGAPIVEVEGVSAILGDLGDDDDELLGK